MIYDDDGDGDDNDDDGGGGGGAIQLIDRFGDGVGWVVR